MQSRSTTDAARKGEASSEPFDQVELENAKPHGMLMRLPTVCISRHNGCPLVRAPRTDDGRHVAAGLLAHGSGAFVRLPDFGR